MILTCFYLDRFPWEEEEDQGEKAIGKEDVERLHGMAEIVARMMKGGN